MRIDVSVLYVAPPLTCWKPGSTLWVMFNDKISFEQAVRYLTLDEVLRLACSLQPPPVTERTLVALPTTSRRRTDAPTVRAT